MHKTRMGAIALTCAAVDDVTAWCLLALVVGVVNSAAASAVVTAILAAIFIAVMFFIGRPLMQRLVVLYGTRGRQTRSVMAIVFVSLLLSSLATEAIGIHAVFGAFVLGAVIPHDSNLARDLTERLEDLVVVLFLPAFFAFTGLRTQIGLVSGEEEWLLCGAILLTATLGKFGGSFVAGVATGLPVRDSAVLGVLMNTRGLMELIVLNIGLELGVISPTLFAMLVVMAVVTTFVTAPMVSVLVGRRRGASDEETPATPPPAPKLAGVLLPVANPSGLEPLIDLALAATKPGEPAPRALTLVPRPIEGVRSPMRELEDERPPRADILVHAMAHANERGTRVDAEAHWTDDLAADMLSVADRAQVSWMILGFHRPVFGKDSRGGVVRDILEVKGGRACHVAVVLHRHERPLSRVAAVVDDSRDGRAALELALRISRDDKESSLHVMVVPKEGTQPEAGLTQLLKDAARHAGRWLHTDVVPAGGDLRLKTAVDLAIIGESLADRIGLPMRDDDDDDEDDGRCVVVAQAGTQAIFP